jgi:hypothetical protein
MGAGRSVRRRRGFRGRPTGGRQSGAAGRSGNSAVPFLRGSARSTNVAEVVSPPDELLLLCGMSIGCSGPSSSVRSYGCGHRVLSGRRGCAAWSRSRGGCERRQSDAAVFVRRGEPGHGGGGGRFRPRCATLLVQRQEICYGGSTSPFLAELGWSHEAEGADSFGARVPHTPGSLASSPKRRCYAR